MLQQEKNFISLTNGNFANKNKRNTLENRKILTFQEIKYIILLWVPIHCTLLLIVATIYLELQGQALY